MLIFLCCCRLNIMLVNRNMALFGYSLLSELLIGQYSYSYRSYCHGLDGHEVRI
jgi:hypothetical protein